MKPKSIFVPVSENLAQRVAQAMAGLAGAGVRAPAVVVDSPLAAQAIKLSLAASGWPGRAEGAPLPWCGTLEQALELAITKTMQAPEVPAPRSIALRRVQLAQQLLDHRDIARSLGGSAKAALDLAGKWADLFEGWEWLDGNPVLNDAAHLQADLGTLKALQLQNTTELDRAAWMRRYAHHTQQPNQSAEIWFCMGHSPSPRELAIAQSVWNVDASQITVWLSEALPLSSDSFDIDSLNGELQSSRLLIEAGSVEESAWAAVQTILQWRNDGIDDIGVLPLDRKAARRLRALLERAGESFSDRSGWALDTSVAASAVVGLNDLLTGHATTQSVLEWSHSPFVRAGLKEKWYFDASHGQALDAALRAFGRVAPISIDDLLTQRLLPYDARVMATLACKRRLPLGQWADHLLKAFEHCGIEEPLSRDTAGQAVLAALQNLQAINQSDVGQNGIDQSNASRGVTISATLWNSVLTEELNAARFVESTPTAAVRVCSMTSLVWRQPKALVVLGADVTRLPERGVPQFFEPHRFAQMGLINSPEATEAEMLSHFVSIWYSRFPATFIACSEKPDSEVEFSNWIELLALKPSALLKREKAADFIKRYDLDLNSFLSDPAKTDPALSGAHWSQQLPATLMVTDLQKLVQCPYQFYLQALLGLRPVKELEEGSPPTDLGSLIHLVLKGAKMHLESAADWQAWLKQRVDEELSRPFFISRHGQSVQLPIPGPIAASLRADVMAVIPKLSQWLASRRLASQGVVTEHDLDVSVESLGVTIKGRIDRLEGDGDEQTHLIDFKTTEAGELQKRSKPDQQGAFNDVQLALYAWMSSAAEASYVSVRRDEVAEVGLAEVNQKPLAEVSRAALHQVTQALSSIAQGEAVRITGFAKDRKVCEYCNVRGICRRDDYSVEQLRGRAAELTAGASDEEGGDHFGSGA